MLVSMYRHVPRSLPAIAGPQRVVNITVRTPRLNRPLPSYHSSRDFSGSSLLNAPDPLDQDANNNGSDRNQSNDSDPTLKGTILRMFETAATTFASIAVLGYESHRCIIDAGISKLTPF